MSISLRFGAIEVRTAERRLLVAGRPVRVGARAFDVLQALVERRDRVVSKDELLDIVWPAAVVEENNLHVHVAALRKLLGAAAILTVPGRGYRFTADDEAAADDIPAAGGPSPPPIEASRGNLPARLADLYGRDGALSTLLTLLASQALVTIAGAGGIGKTRLAQAVAHRLRQRYPQGVWMIELASLADPALVAPNVARVLRIKLSGREPPFEELARALHTQTMLLVLDNCEHLLDAVSRLATAILAAAPGVQLLVTSQEPLRIPAERLFRLAPLAVPSTADIAQAVEFGAVRLFIERVRALDPQFVLTHRNTEAVIDICRQLDGMALAIEFAAARVPALGVHGIQDRLNERFRMLTAGERLSQPRHRTLHAALDWSHQLLGDAEQTVFRRLGVFVGDFSLEAAQAVVADAAIDAWAALDLLGALVDKSLVLTDGRPRPRYRLLETTRAYALEKLAAAHETGTWLRRHAATTRTLLEAAVRRRDVDTVVLEMNNVRAAFAWAAGPQGDPLLAVELAVSSAMVLAVEGFVTEALDRLLGLEPIVADSARGVPIPAAMAARFWQWLGRLGREGRLPTSRCLEVLQRAEAAFRAQGDARKTHACLRMRAEALLQTGDLAAARAALAAAETMETAESPVADRMRRLRVETLLLDMQGRTRDALMTAQQAHALANAAGIERYVLTLLGDMAGLQLKLGRPQEAESSFRAVAAKARTQANGGLALCQALSGLIVALVAQSRLDAASAVAAEAVPLLHRSGLFLARCDTLAWLAAHCGRMHAAARLASAADAFRQRSEIARDPAEARMRGEVAALLCTSCGDTQVGAWLAEGAASKEIDLMRLFEPPAEPHADP